MDTNDADTARRPGTAIIVGAGIGGLTAALALYRRGWRVRVLERASKLEPVGAGIALAPNAAKVLDLLGLTSRLGGAAVIQGSGGVRRPDGPWLVRTDLSRVESRFGRPLSVMPRAELVDALIEHLPQGSVSLGRRVLDVDPGDAAEPAVVYVARGSATESLRADVVVAADGIRSAMRARLLPTYPGPAYAGFTAWRFIAHTPERTIEPSETWGRGAIFGIVQLPRDRVYCYGTANLPPDTSFPDEHAALAAHFAGWHEPIGELIAQTPAEAVLRNDIWWLAKPLPAYHRGRVALLGDAAHAMTPNLGQGGCQAIEDAVVLAHHLGSATRAAAPGHDVPAALAAYTADRLARTTRVARQSYRTARMQQLESPSRIALRNTLIKALGKLGPGLMLRQMAPLASWTPPLDPAE